MQPVPHHTGRPLCEAHQHDAEPIGGSSADSTRAPGRVPTTMASKDNDWDGGSSDGDGQGRPHGFRDLTPGFDH